MSKNIHDSYDIFNALISLSTLEKLKNILITAMSQILKGLILNSVAFLQTWLPEAFRPDMLSNPVVVESGHRLPI